jgi:two-component system NtrC family response regulator
MKKATILVVDDDKNFRRVTAANLEKEGFAVETASDADDALRSLAAHTADLVVSDIRMPGKDGMELFRLIRARHSGLPVVLITAYATVEKAVEAIKEGAADYLTKPFSREDLLRSVRKALELKRLTDENRKLKSALAGNDGAMVGQSAGLKRALDTLAQAAASEATILIQGESGTGKELAARFVHKNSSRAHGPFVAVNCAALPHELLESELFGHRRGAFTGAVRDQQGRFERAHGGTLFLDEIGDLPLSLQPKLLRVLEENKVEPLGAGEALAVDVRLVTATHRNLRAMVDAGEFRRDLYYRINVIPVTLPALRERGDDIPLLIRHFAARHGNPDLEIEADALERLMEYPWPGNVRELDNLVARWALIAGKRAIGIDDLPEEVDGARVAPTTGIPGLRDQERDLIVRALEKAHGNQSKAAQILGIPRHVLIYRLKKYGIGKE